jgi:hypothetical protein
MSPASDDLAMGSDDVTPRAQRLLRWYPKAWRDRDGAEFTELLISGIQERPRSARRILDVAMAVFVAGYGAWVAEKAELTPRLPLGFSVGAINVAIALLLAVAARAARRAALAPRPADQIPSE